MVPPGRAQAAGWAGGLRQLYQVAIAEPLPPGFSELLARLEVKSASGSSNLHR
jgi:hypothetical protein